MKKFWLGTVVVLVLVGIGGVLYFLSNLNSIIAQVIEEQGSRVTSTEVGVSGVDISLREGRGTVAGFSIASPAGFETDHAFTLGEITVDIDLGSVREDPVVIEEIRVRAPVVNAEFLQSGSLNIDVLRKNIQQYTASQGGDGAQKNDDLKRVRIKRFIFEKGRIEVDATELGLEARSLDLPAISLENIGGAEGARPDEIAQVVFDALTRKATAEIARAEIDQMVEDKVMDTVTDKAQGLLDKLEK